MLPIVYGLSGVSDVPEAYSGKVAVIRVAWSITILSMWVAVVTSAVLGLPVVAITLFAVAVILYVAVPAARYVVTAHDL